MYVSLLALLIHSLLYSMDGDVSHEDQLQKIETAFGEVSKASDVVLIEGTH